MSYLTRVEDLIGTVDDTTGINQFASDAARQILPTLSEAMLKNYASRTLISNDQGFASTGKIILSVSRGGYPCREVDETQKQLIRNTASIFLSSAEDPVFYQEVGAADTRLYIVPDPASGAEAQISYVAYPDVDTSLSEIDGYPVEAEAALVLYVAIRVLQKRIEDHDAEEDIELIEATRAQVAELRQLYNEEISRLTNTEQ